MRDGLEYKIVTHLIHVFDAHDLSYKQKKAFLEATYQQVEKTEQERLLKEQEKQRLLEEQEKQRLLEEQKLKEKQE